MFLLGLQQEKKLKALRNQNATHIGVTGGKPVQAEAMDTEIPVGAQPEGKRVTDGNVTSSVGHVFRCCTQSRDDDILQVTL